MGKEFDLWNKYGSTQKEDAVALGPHTSYEYNNSRRAILFSMARYKFAMKLLSGGGLRGGNKISVIDLGCSDGLGTYYVAEFAEMAVGVDFDEEAIEWAQSHPTPQSDNVKFIRDDFLGKTYGEFDGVVSFDVLEHIYPENEPLFMETVLSNLSDTGTAIIGTPSLESQQYSKDNVTGAHVNVKTGEELYSLMSKYFHTVFLFTQNDEIIHTGHVRMANYLLAVGTHKKEFKC